MLYRSAGWAFGILALSYATAHALDLAGMGPLANIAFLPFFPPLLVVVGLMGGPHAANGEPYIMLYTGMLTFAVWWGAIFTYYRATLARSKSRDRRAAGLSR